MGARILRAKRSRPHPAGMEKSTFSPLYEVFRAKLLAMRKAAGLSQRQLADLLGREHSFVGRIELGERRLDLVEFYWVCQACGRDAVKVAGELMTEFRKHRTKRSR